MNNYAELTKNLPDNPFAAFGKWYAEALQLDTPHPNTMVLCTSANAQPTARIVLLKFWDEHGFVFYTNYTSLKAQQMDSSPHVALLFYWDNLYRQVRIEGSFDKTSREESAAYYNSRPRVSRIGAWASRQSQQLDSRARLDKRVERYAEHYAHQDPPLPDFWGGYRVVPLRMEFWQGEKARLHQRRQFTRPAADKPWASGLLYP